VVPRVAVWKPLISAVPSTVPPSQNSTNPVGLTFAAPLTLAVSRTTSNALDGFGAATSVVTVAAFAIV
jgi:hypothetical protein